MLLRCASRTIDRSTPIVMGVLNVTPDSFSDGGKYRELDRAITQAMRMAEEGAGFIDIGGESTRPGAEPVPEDEELRRVIPVIEALVRRLDTPIRASRA
jgi:dihydropteroate synthase